MRIGFNPLKLAELTEEYSNGTESVVGPVDAWGVSRKDPYRAYGPGKHALNQTAGLALNQDGRAVVPTTGQPQNQQNRRLKNERMQKSQVTDMEDKSNGYSAKRLLSD